MRGAGCGGRRRWSCASAEPASLRTQGLGRLQDQHADNSCKEVRAPPSTGLCGPCRSCISAPSLLHLGWVGATCNPPRSNSPISISLFLFSPGADLRRHLPCRAKQRSTIYMRLACHCRLTLLTHLQPHTTTCCSSRTPPVEMAMMMKSSVKSGVARPMGRRATVRVSAAAKLNLWLPGSDRPAHLEAATDLAG